MLFVSGIKYLKCQLALSEKMEPILIRVSCLGQTVEIRHHKKLLYLSIYLSIFIFIIAMF